MLRRWVTTTNVFHQRRNTTCRINLNSISHNKPLVIFHNHHHFHTQRLIQQQQQTATPHLVDQQQQQPSPLILDNQQHPTTQQPIKKRRRIVPLREPFKLTESAAKRVHELMKTKEGAIGLRVGMTRRGCNGLTTTLDYVYENSVPKTFEEVTDKGVKVYVDPSCLMFVIGTTMDFIDDETKSEFVFHNPNAQSQCGCGDSISIPEKVAMANLRAIEKYKANQSSESQQQAPPATLSSSSSPPADY